MNMVESNAIDLGVVEGPVNNKNLIVEVCRMDQLVVVTPAHHPLAGPEPVAVHRLASYPYICREEGSGTREVIFDYLSAAGLGAGDLNIVESWRSAVQRPSKAQSRQGWGFLCCPG